MKKTAIAYSMAFLAVVLAAAASVWEGSAIAAAPGDLPDSGYYIATNSFPRNTVVDIKNLENDKTIRVVVSGPLDSPGLLAALSPEAVAALSINRKAVTRVRISMPVDTVAFSRYTEGLADSADPDRNPAAAVAAAGGLPAAGAAPLAAATPPAVVPPAAAVPSAPASSPSPAEIAPPAAAEEVPVDIPDDYTPPEPAEEAAAEPGEPMADSAPAAAELPPEAAVAPAEEAIPPAEAAAVAQAAEPVAAAVPAPLAGDEAVPAETAETAEPESDQAPTAEAAAAAVEPAPAPEASAAAPVAAPAEIPSETTEPGPADIPPADAVITLEPSEERPPVAETDELAGPMVAPIPEQAEAEPEASPEPALDESLFVPPVAKAAPAAAVPPAPSAVAASVPPAKAPSVPESSAGLVSGKYYVQIGVFGRIAAAEDAVRRLGTTYPAFIQKSAAGYRVLVGPLNQGESGAMVLRFKRAGFPDAFAKRGS